MSILKGILHHWNKTNNAYDTIHPETEVAQITDFNQGIVNTLASTALGGLVNTLTSDSLIGTIMQKVLTASGVKYLAAQNGYLCLGKFFGGIIIQWITALASNSNVGHSFNLPINCKVYAYSISHIGSSPRATGIENNKAYDAGWTNTPVWIISIGSL